MATIKIVVLPGGEVQTFVDGDVTYDEASLRTQTIIARLRERGIPLKLTSGIESHRNEGVTHVHIIASVDTH